MRFSELMERVRGRGVIVAEMRATNDPEVLGVSDDSRKTRPGDLFIARAGANATGTQYVDEAFARGAVAVVLQEDVGLSCGMAWARVGDIHFAGALLAHEVAGNPTAGMKMIGITGTKGKTTVAYLMRSVLKAGGHKVGMIGTVEIDDGETAVPADMTTPGAVELVALFSRMKANGVTHCIMEVSSHALHQHRVAGIDFALAIFTNLTGDHLDYHKTMEEYAAAKAMLFEGLRPNAVAVVNADDEWAEKLVEKCPAKIVRIHVEMGLEEAGLKVVAPPRDGWSALITQLRSDGMSINLKGPEPIRNGYYPMYKMTTPLVGRHNAYNILSVVAAVHSLAMPDANFMKGIRALPQAKGAPGRLQTVVHERLKQEDMPFQVLVDYAHTHDALENVLTALRATMGSRTDEPSAGGMLSGHSDRAPTDGGLARAAEHGTRSRLICLFGCGGDRDRTKRPKMGAVAERLADVVIVTSDNPRTENPAVIIDEICAGFSPGWREAGKITIEPDRRTAIKLAIDMADSGDVVLLAGKGHENYQIIGTTKHHFDDVEEAQLALETVLKNRQVAKTPS